MARTTSKTWARAGGGTYQALEANSLAFDIQVTPIARGFVQNRLYLVNLSRVVAGDLLLPDSDQDGLADRDEPPLGLSPAKPDSGGVGCHDRTQDISGDNAGLCPRICSRSAADGGMLTDPLGDDDGDSLLNCEEVALTLDSNRPDTDGDDLTDDLELRFGTNPLDPQTASLDADHDGITDQEEIFAGTDPLTRQTGDEIFYRYAPLRAVADSNGHCQIFRVDNVRLVETAASAVSAAGDNRICVYMVEHTVDHPTGEPTVSRACRAGQFSLCRRCGGQDSGRR